MPDDRQERLSWEEFEQRFQTAFGREMTSLERRWFQLSRMVEDKPKSQQEAEEKGTGTAA